ncbi:MAG: chemotaxis protein CheD [Pseudomonadota bacterium]
MSHFILPSRSDKPLKSPLDARYGDEAIQLLLNGLISLGVSPLQCQAKIFGGGNMFPSKKHLHMFDIGQRNGEIARSLLQRYNIPLISEHLFGEGHRQIIFNVSNGQVWTRLVKPIELPDTKKE